MVKRAGATSQRSGKRQKISAGTPRGSRSSQDCCIPTPLEPAAPPTRRHGHAYHRPLLLDKPAASASLLSWYDGTSTTRQMPWRKPFSSTLSRSERSVRAYEVWVSEIMLQQTRVSTVIPYYNAWISKWPTVQDLAAATQDEVLAAWKGLGYYSRATRLWSGAKMTVDELDGEMPGTVEGLLKVPGVGPYTAGAIGSIAFGKRVPLVDGNVARVVSRQVGLFADMKRKEVDKLIWQVAQQLVQGVERVAAEEEEVGSDVPGRWNQAIMELGSTICTPRPKCGSCPIRETCRTYAEGSHEARKSIARPEQGVVDMEDACGLCEPLAPEELEIAKGEVESSPALPSTRMKTAEDGPSKRKPVASDDRRKQRSLKDFAFTTMKDGDGNANGITTRSEGTGTADLDQTIVAYCSLFPKRTVKKKVPEATYNVYIDVLHNQAGEHYLIHKRPDTGLLANMWEFKTTELDEQGAEKKEEGGTTVTGGPMTPDTDQDEDLDLTSNSVNLGEVTHVFSHLKMKMNVIYRRTDSPLTDSVPRTAGAGGVSDREKWVAEQGIEEATMGTGMQKCWQLFKDWRAVQRKAKKWTTMFPGSRGAVKRREPS